MESVLAFIQSDDRLKGLRHVESPVSPEEEAIHHGHSSSSPLAAGEDAPFRWDHVRVKLKKEVLLTPKKRRGCPALWEVNASSSVVLNFPFLYVDVDCYSRNARSIA